MFDPPEDFLQLHYLSEFVLTCIAPECSNSARREIDGANTIDTIYGVVRQLKLRSASRARPNV